MKIIDSKISVNTETKTFTIGVAIGTDDYAQSYVFTNRNPFICIQDIWKTIDQIHGSELGIEVYHDLYAKYANLVATMVIRQHISKEQIGFWYDDDIAFQREKMHQAVGT